MPDTSALIPENEFERALKLSEYDIDYSEIHGKLDDLTRLAAHVAGTPISLINLLDTTTQWTVSKVGLDVLQTPREETVCQYVVLDDESLEVEDMTEDERFKDKEYVKNSPHIKYYYGVPLKTPDGHRIGAMCVMDTDEHDLTPEKESFLKIIANEVITRIEYEHKLKLMRHNVDELKEIQRKVSHDIRGPIGGIIGIAEILRDQAKGEKKEELMQLLELINKGGRSVLDLADEILSDFEDQSQENQLFKNQLTLEVLQKKLEDLYKPQALNKSIDYKIVINNGHQGLTFPKHKLLQIFGNLVSNAIKFTPENGSVEVSLDIKKPDLGLIGVIKDNGVGMSGEQIKEIMGNRGRSTKGTGQERGFGFGFKLAKHLTESINGSLLIESQKNEGTEITVNIPL
ncbi:MAG: GAF domain-containing protein [Gracilimonas sp.]|uniref:GAF domain-containing sensor histidine kinase n=1 Tax=Gracilimonas TaxID=649462 RepID=UPI001B2BB002|nr:ATP-binding protein [Gracilimonas sp.]MBO6586894.1 GAF domain-containing protein [Gracilimonas sp.]MBO6614618.1 GAF domain-containing protein [Gracilimonas sp.]